MLAALGFQCVCKRAQAKNMNKWNEKWASTNVAFRCLVRRWDRRSEIFRLHKIRLRFVYIRAIARNPLKIREIIKSNKIAQESAVFSKIKNPIMNLGPIRLPDWNHRSTIEKKVSIQKFQFEIQFRSETKIVRQRSGFKSAQLWPIEICTTTADFMRRSLTVCDSLKRKAESVRKLQKLLAANFWIKLHLIFKLSCT